MVHDCLTKDYILFSIDINCKKIFFFQNIILFLGSKIKKKTYILQKEGEYNVFYAIESMGY